ncbi:MAG: TetR/AcrR family transcriptional regulator [Kiloniellales bacterium]
MIPFCDKRQAMAPLPDIKARILESAQAIVELQGYGGLSYDLIADLFGIGTSSVQSHFPRKAELCAQVAARYRDLFRASLQQMQRDCADSMEILERYAALFRKALVEQNRMSLCGLGGAEAGKLPREVIEQVGGFFDCNRNWLAGVLQRGRDRGELRLEAEPAAEAGLLLAALEGAMVVARSTGVYESFDDSVATLLSRYRPKAT